MGREPILPANGRQWTLDAVRVLPCSEFRPDFPPRGEYACTETLGGAVFPAPAGLPGFEEGDEESCLKPAREALLRMLDLVGRS